jgi:hypothetical protein
MTNQEEQAIRERCAQATPGPWIGGSYVVHRIDERRVRILFEPRMPDLTQKFADTMFVACARTDIPQLLAEIDRLRSLLKEANHAPP